MPPVDIFRLSFSVLDGDEPKRWSIWSLPFPDVEKLVRGTIVKVVPYTTLSEFFLLDQTIEQLDSRDSWTNVIGTVVHMSDKDHLERLREVHQRHCQYIKRAPDAACNRFGYYVLPVVEPGPHGNAQDLVNYSTNFVRDARLALGRHVAEGPLTARSAASLKGHIEDIAQRIVMLHEQEQDK